MNKTFLVLLSSVVASILIPALGSAGALSEAQMRDRVKRFGRDLNTWYPMRGTCGDGERFEGRRSEVVGKLAAFNRAAGRMESFALGELSEAFDEAYFQLTNNRNIVFDRRQLMLSTATLVNGVNVAPSLDTVALARGMVEVQGAQEALMRKITQLSGNALRRLRASGFHASAVRRLERAMRSIRSLSEQLDDAWVAARRVVECRRSEDEVAYIVRHINDAEAPVSAQTELPNTLAAPVRMGEVQCESTQQIAESMPELVSAADQALLSAQSPMVRAVAAEFTMHWRHANGRYVTGLARYLNDFLGRLQSE